MRDLFVSSQFRKDLQREYAGQHKALREELALVLGRLMFDVPLEMRHKDHGLTGNWAGSGGVGWAVMEKEGCLWM
ncbi:type II toxin-antitoxin system YafQ family toxin [Comamonas flocculans]|uniref:Type II toxin-antitoxin system YafQ family toxin n=1 Tax=Comamonas flocculans TaxID=2597701 RepID=A0A5B8RTV3_9BURK|nr:type II toxin-antitoxin system YafQ family toxin [Comamonas flocculans]QEA12543.1 hypothetical protein FOZ74_05590 [Comamonas flocculans]